MTIDPETGAITELLDLHTLSDIMGFDLAFSGYDPIEKKLYQVVETARSLVTLISVDVVNPNKSTSKPLNTGQSISDFLIAPVFHKGLLYGFMKNLTFFMRFMVTSVDTACVSHAFSMIFLIISCTAAKNVLELHACDRPTQCYKKVKALRVPRAVNNG